MLQKDEYVHLKVCRLDRVDKDEKFTRVRPRCCTALLDHTTRVSPGPTGSHTYLPACMHTRFDLTILCRPNVVLNIIRPYPRIFHPFKSLLKINRHLCPIDVVFKLSVPAQHLHIRTTYIINVQTQQNMVNRSKVKFPKGTFL